MNKARRCSIEKAVDNMDTIKQILEDILDEEQEYYENIPENLQCSERALSSQDAIEYILEAIENLDCAISGLTDAIAV